MLKLEFIARFALQHLVELLPARCELVRDGELPIVRSIEIRTEPLTEQRARTKRAMRALQHQIGTCRRFYELPLPLIGSSLRLSDEKTGISMRLTETVDTLRFDVSCE